MNWLKEMFGGQDNKRQEIKPPVKPATPADRIRATPRAGAPSTSERFRFKEGVGANVQTGAARTTGVPAFGKYSPKPGTCAVEIFDENGAMMAYDLFRVDEVPPPAAHLVKKYPKCTEVRSGKTNLGHIELEFDLRGEHPVELPEHILAKRELGARYAKLWWSKHEYTG